MFVFERCIYKYYDIHILAHTNSCTLNKFPCHLHNNHHKHTGTETHTQAHSKICSLLLLEKSASAHKKERKTESKRIFFFSKRKEHQIQKWHDPQRENNMLSRGSVLVMCMLLLMLQMVELMPISMWRDVVLLNTTTHGIGEWKNVQLLCLFFFFFDICESSQGLKLCLCLCLCTVYE